MSIINDALNDLDQQQQAYANNLKHSAVKPPSKAPYRTLIILILLVMVIVIAWLVLKPPLQKGAMPASEKQLSIPQAEVSITPSAQLAPVSDVSVEVTQPIALAEENRLKNFQLNALNEGVMLEFKLDKEPVSYLKSYSKNQYVYHLVGVSNKIRVPSDIQQQWLKSIQITPVDNGLDLIITSAEQALVGVSWQVSDNEGVRLIVNITSAPNAEPVITAAPKVAPLPTKTVTNEVKPLVAKPSEKAPAVTNNKAVKLEIVAKKAAPTAEQQLAQANELMATKQWALARQKLEAIKNSDVDYQARRNLLSVYSRLNLTREREALLQSSLLIYPKDTGFNYLRAKQAFHSGDFVSAMNTLQSLEQKNFQVFALLGQSAQRLGKHGQAIQSFRQALNLKQQAPTWLAMALSLEKIKRYQQAINAYNQAILDPNITQKLKQFASKRTITLQQYIQ